MPKIKKELVAKVGLKLRAPDPLTSYRWSGSVFKDLAEGRDSAYY